MMIATGRTHSLALKVVLAASLWLMASLAHAFDVKFDGVTDDDLVKALEGASLLVEKEESDEPLSVQEIISIAQADYRRLLAELYDNGYFGPVIRILMDGREASSIDPVSPPRTVNRVVIRVTPGQRFRFGRANVRPLAPETTMPEEFQSGERARLSAIRDGAEAGVSGWRAAGHAKASVAGQKVTANHRDALIDAEVLIAPGARLRFGPLVVSGNRDVRTERIVEIAGLPEGAVFSPEELERSAKRLRRTGAFRSVALVEPEEIGPGETLPIDARVVEQKPRRFGFGGELATQEGLTLTAYWMHRNLLGGAENLRVDGEVAGIAGNTGGVDYTLDVRFERPATFDEDITLYVLGEAQKLNQVNFTTKQATIGAGIEWNASDDQTYIFGLGVRREKDQDVFGSKDFSLLMFHADAVLDYRDVQLDATKGYFARATLTPFLATSGADNGLLTELDFRKYLSFGSERRTTLAVRAQLGSLAGPSLEGAPSDFLFYSGGGGTVRGHKFQSLGVDVGLDDDVGGRSFLGVSAELRMRTTGNLGFVGFADAGYIGRESYPGGSGRWQSGAGVGFRYATAVGPIRVDLAVPTTGDDNGSKFQIYIGIGQSF